MKGKQCHTKRNSHKIDILFNLRVIYAHAEMVELVDTLASGASGGNPVEVRVLFSVPLNYFKIVRNSSNST